ncbi:hypothetical protein CYMTET_24156 [Cymbomonas tetramitiformis]|uniref:EF-hand domain-containing protein n=1 Tax=Cymbomonas tetramitiformis TaxID=36881 RepID=A0AAE0L0J6_9CHLO|nr:hypothetical protein CYMTET_24156 [Cymbomonas tetramitiformis]
MYPGMQPQAVVYQTQSSLTSTANAPFLQPGSERFLPQWFQSVDQDRTGQISVKELQRTLNQNGLNYSLKFCASLIRMNDKSNNGVADYQEFCELHRFLVTAQQMFLHADSDRSGYLSLPQVHHAITSAGFQLDETSFYAACQSFDVERSGKFTLDYFIAFYVFLTNARSIFTAFDSNQSGSITLDFSRFVYATAGTS